MFECEFSLYIKETLYLCHTDIYHICSSCKFCYAAYIESSSTMYDHFESGWMWRKGHKRCSLKHSIETYAYYSPVVEMNLMYLIGMISIV